MRRTVCIDQSSMGESSLYGVQGRFIEGLNRAFSAIGLESRLVLANTEFPGEMIQNLVEDIPDCTVAFNGVPSNDQGYYVCDDLQVPHVNIMLDAPYLFFKQFNSEYALFTSIDRMSEKVYHTAGHGKVHFLPHAADSRDVAGDGGERTYDAVMLSSFIDPDKMRALWKETYPQFICKLMDIAVDLMLETPGTAAPLAFMTAARLAGPVIADETIPMWLIYYEIDQFIKGWDRVALIKSIRETRVDLFSSSHKGSWKDLIKQDNVFIHEGISFREALKVMGKSKVVLNSSPHIPDGAHERVFSGLISGAAVLSSHSKYLAEQFSLGSGIKFYTPGSYGSVDKTLSGMLADEEFRRDTVKRGKALVMENHTWESRARQIRDELGPIVDAMKK